MATVHGGLSTVDSGLSTRLWTVQRTVRRTVLLCGSAAYKVWRVLHESYAHERFKTGSLVGVIRPSAPWAPAPWKAHVLADPGCRVVAKRSRSCIYMIRFRNHGLLAASRRCVAWKAHALLAGGRGRGALHIAPTSPPCTSRIKPPPRAWHVDGNVHVSWRPPEPLRRDCLSLRAGHLYPLRWKGILPPASTAG